MKNFAPDPAQSPSSYREPTLLSRATRLPIIVLEGQRHVVEIRDNRDGITRQYVIETKRVARDQYDYELIYRTKWEGIDRLVYSGAQFGSSELAVEDALRKVEAWERWLDASRPNEI